MDLSADQSPVAWFTQDGFAIKVSSRCAIRIPPAIFTICIRYLWSVSDRPELCSQSDWPKSERFDWSRCTSRPITSLRSGSAVVVTPQQIGIWSRTWHMLVEGGPLTAIQDNHQVPFYGLSALESHICNGRFIQKRSLWYIIQEVSRK